jgi:anaerobic C4-dicarboxylate transporter DcuB
VSKFVNSQAAALAAIVPVALAIGVDPAYIVASAPACYGYYILPTYPSDLAAIQFDRSGTTHIGRFVINHSFILPGLIGVSVSCVFGWVFAAMYGFLVRRTGAGSDACYSRVYCAMRCDDTVQSYRSPDPE